MSTCTTIFFLVCGNVALQTGAANWRLSARLAAVQHLHVVEFARSGTGIVVDVKHED